MKKADPKAQVRTLEDAYRFVRSAGICFVFPNKNQQIASLWDVVDFPEKQPGEAGWGQKVSHVWSWKNRLPADYPDEIFYGKTKGGKTVLMTLEFLATEYYPEFHRPPAQCSPLARKILDLISIEPMTTGELRKAVIKGNPSFRAAFAKALIELQVTLNITRSTAPEVDVENWLPDREQSHAVIQRGPYSGRGIASNAQNWKPSMLPWLKMKGWPRRIWSPSTLRVPRRPAVKRVSPCFKLPSRAAFAA